MFGSCQELLTSSGVVDQFRAKYPNVNVEVENAIPEPLKGPYPSAEPPRVGSSGLPAGKEAK
jgi:hypothetical protein